MREGGTEVGAGRGGGDRQTKKKKKGNISIPDPNRSFSKVLVSGVLERKGQRSPSKRKHVSSQ